ncbi:MAG: CopG family transcriptional regulator [Gammaproteobacteria bacterium]|nr:CopG family transcriptional regulator [Gammaproteobacteria bacterium]
MISVRLEPDMEQRLNYLSEQLKISKTQIIKDSLGMYFDSVDAVQQASTPFELGEGLFGRFASGENDRSERYKQAIKDKIRAKNAH